MSATGFFDFSWLAAEGLDRLAAACLVLFA